MTTSTARYPRERFGLPDDAFVYRAPEKGLITKREIRVISLARMELAPDSTVWDIGAGSGSVGVEAARLCPQGAVFAIEKNRDDFALVQTNCERFGVTNLTALCEKAPAGLEAWPDPDAVFIGGSGGLMAELLDVVTIRMRPGGRLVINLVTLDNLAETVGYCKELGWPVDYTLAQISRSKPILSLTRYDALNPVTIVTAKKPIGGNGEGVNRG
jgi:precorrin-6Y C5,15-methyltransferase (decarboxylating)